MGLWLPDRELIRPPGLSRRGFLRALGVTAAVVAVPGLAVPRRTFFLLDHDLFTVTCILPDGTLVTSLFRYRRPSPESFRFPGPIPWVEEPVFNREDPIAAT